MKPSQQLKHILIVFCAGAFSCSLAQAQPYDIYTFDVTAPGPWSDVTNTTVQVPKVPNGSIKLDANPSSAEYGGFKGITVTPGDNAWILDFPGDRVWDGAADSSFTFWLAHDDDNLYVGVDVKDDIVNSDDRPAEFWKDDSIEIVIDALNDRLDTNTDSSNDPYGGHCYVNYLGAFSRWDPDTGTINGSTWSSALDWKYGPAEDIYGVGTNVVGGWKMEVRFKKSLFEDPAVTNKLENGYVMGFNIGLDDDDMTGIGVNGSGARSQDLEIQYFWANRERHIGLTPAVWADLTPEQRTDETFLNDNYPLAIDSTGRLTHGGAGQIVFQAGTPSGPISGLLGYWRMDETEGTVVSDWSGKNHPGKIINNAVGSWVTDPERGTVYHATGTNVIDFGTILPVMTLTNDFTWSLWLNSFETGTASTPDNNIVFGNRYKTGTTDFSPREFIKFTPSKFEWHVNGAGQDIDYPDFPTNKWTHHVVVKTGNKLAYYRDGVVMVNTNTITAAPINPQPLSLGGQGTQERWKGLADEVAIFDRALSEAEVQQVFALGKAGRPLAPAPLVLAAPKVDAASLTVTWTGGTPPFKVQARDNLSTGNWADVGSSTNERTATVPRQGPTLFVRVVGQ